jgi:hypothetical protein
MPSVPDHVESMRITRKIPRRIFSSASGGLALTTGNTERSRAFFVAMVSEFNTARSSSKPDPQFQIGPN